MQLHRANARKIEDYLAAHPKVRSVLWPGSPRHPQHELAASQMSNFSGLLCFTLKQDGDKAALRLADTLRVISYAVSLGKTRSLLFYIPTEDFIQSSFRLDGANAQAYRDSAGRAFSDSRSAWRMLTTSSQTWNKRCDTSRQGDLLTQR
ncbi:PLP-dependent transferase [Ensifer sp. BR816]|uniref:PLP-dependent transferase n=1 Tax=Rhizobium sp. (strain BR816) TaxID=1057002 RepID=UPI00039D2125|nr:PLP-dependent transferase [Ensifer sp. BR816]